MVRRLFCLLLLLAGSARAAPVSGVVTLPTRPGVTQRFLLLTPSQPAVASVVLFAGGDGHIGIGDDGRLERGGNFLVRTREAWAQQGFLVAVPDTPSDQDGIATFRESAEHATDIAAVVDFLRQRADVPVWLVGTSRGTTSAAAAGIRLQSRIAGVVLTSTVARGRGNVAGLELGRLARPVLLMYHRDDSCKATPPAGAEEIVRALSAAPVKARIAEEGGISRGEPCEAFAYHGYNGIEERVVRDAADWIKAPHALP
ncbi:alpha/beta hydrolase [Paludibacterium yongneupense]|uniref:alpha/beta hydrolase n=1 Tax=Paludibacterium yongneupense TaxID=400061 RepID=UPI00041389AF|nr:hypothetical protein [Paludibacterium yongneupense]